MKKLISFITAFIIPLCTVSCGEKGTPSETSVENTVETLQLSFQEANITIAEDFNSIISLDKLDEQVLIFGTDNSGKYIGYITDRNFSDYQQFDFSPKDNETVKSACIGKFGKTAVVTLCNNELIMYIFNKDGELFKEYNLGEHEFNTDMGAIITANDDSFIINLNNETLLSITADGTVQSEVNCNGGTIMGFSKDSNDIPTVILSYGDSTEIAHIDGISLSDEQKCSNISTSAYAVCGGNETYSLIANFNDGLYGLNGNTWVKLTDYMDNTFDTFDIGGMLCTGESEFVVSVSGGNSKGLVMLSERDIAEIKAKKVITIATWSDSNISDEIKSFNNKNDDYRIEIKKYSTSNKDEILTQMREDILSGSPPDMLISDRAAVTAESFGAKESLFVDMYEFIDNDTSLSREDFVEGYLEAMDFNGKLLSFAPSFTINTLAVKDKYLNGLSSWSFDKMMDIISSRPENMKIVPWDTLWIRADYMLNMMDYCSFVDFEKAECHYDSDEFISAMKLVQQNELGMTLAQSESFMNNAEDYEYDDYPQERYYIDDKYLIKNFKPYLFSMSDIHKTVSAEFNEPVTFIGYPNYKSAGTKFTPDEHRTFSILRSCKYPEGAWQFIRDTYLTDEFYYGWNGLACFPVLDKYLTEKIDLETTEQTYLDESTGKEVTAYSYYLGNDTNIEYAPFTDSEAEKYGNFVREAAKHRMNYNSVIRDILVEELTSYFEGERSAEDTADIIQNRVSIYVSENYG